MSQETQIGNLSGGISDEDSRLVDSILNDLNGPQQQGPPQQQGAPQQQGPPQQGYYYGYQQPFYSNYQSCNGENSNYMPITNDFSQFT